MTSLDDARIRLEGALEIVEKAALDIERIAARLNRREWLRDAQPLRDELARFDADCSKARDAAARMADRSRAERWPEGSAAKSVLSRYEVAMTRFAYACLESARDAGVVVRRAEDVDKVIAGLSRPPGSQPVYWCYGHRYGNIFWVLFAALGVSSTVFAALRSPRVALVAATVALVVGAMLVLRRLWRVSVSLFPDRLRLRGVGVSRDLFKGWSLETGGMENSLVAPGVGPLALSHAEAGQLSTMQTLVNTVDWPTPVSPPRDAYVAPAFAVQPTTGVDHGAVMACDGQVYFLLSGTRTFDAAAKISRPWVTPHATLLAWALLRAPKEFRDQVIAQMASESTVIALGPRPIVKITATLATFDAIAAVALDKPLRRELEAWLPLFGRAQVTRQRS